jgi:hypothetical protein
VRSRLQRAGALGWIEPLLLAADTAGMARNRKRRSRRPETIYKIAAKAVPLGTVEAADEATAIEKVAAEYKVPTNRLMAIRR